MAYIVFDDGGGDTILRSDWPSPADRFSNWVPANYRPKFGAPGHALANEKRFVFVLRRDYGASFEIRGIGMGSLASGPLDVATRLVAHLVNGGTCKVYTQDTLAASYLNCGLTPNSTPSLQQANKRSMEYTLSLSLLNLDQTPMTCHYGLA